MNIVPGLKTHQFILGSPFQLHNNSQLIFSCQKESMVLIVENSILLRFDSNQFLCQIEIYKLEKRDWTIYSNLLCSQNIIPTFDHVYKIMGPTLKGTIQNKNYILKYPGISFFFTIPKEFIQTLSTLDDLPFKLPDGTCLVLDRITVYKESNSPQPFCTSLNDFLVKVKVIVSFFLVNLKDNTISVCDYESFSFDSSSIDVLSILGKPDLIYNCQGLSKSKLWSLDVSWVCKL